MNKELQLILSKAEHVYSDETLMKKINSGRKLKIKLGADPSRPDLHLGHTVVLRALKHFQNMGHEVIFVIGDFTAMIGDPSGKSKTRPALTFEETRRSGASYFSQVTKILDPHKTKVVYNSEWLSKMDFNDVLKLVELCYNEDNDLWKQSKKIAKSQCFKYFVNLSDVELLALHKSKKVKVKRKEKKYD